MASISISPSWAEDHVAEAAGGRSRQVRPVAVWVVPVEAAVGRVVAPAAPAALECGGGAGRGAQRDAVVTRRDTLTHESATNSASKRVMMERVSSHYHISDIFPFILVSLLVSLKGPVG